VCVCYRAQFTYWRTSSVPWSMPSCLFWSTSCITLSCSSPSIQSPGRCARVEGSSHGECRYRCTSQMSYVKLSSTSVPPCGRRGRCRKCKSVWCSRSFVPVVIRILNHVEHGFLQVHFLHFISL